MSKLTDSGVTGNSGLYSTYISSDLFLGINKKKIRCGCVWSNKTTEP